MATKQTTLCLADKMKLIEYAKLNPTVGTRQIAEVFKCGRTQVQMILKAKESIISDFEMNAPASTYCTYSSLYYVNMQF